MIQFTEQQLRHTMQATQQVIDLTSLFTKGVALLKELSSTSGVEKLLVEADRTLLILTSNRSLVSDLQKDIAVAWTAIGVPSKTGVSAKTEKDFRTAAKELMSRINGASDSIRALHQLTRVPMTKSLRLATTPVNAIEILVTITALFSQWILHIRNAEATRKQPKVIKVEERQLFCIIDCHLSKQKFSAKVLFKKKLPIARAPQAGQFDLADIFITPLVLPGAGATKEHDHFIVQRDDGRGVLLVRDAHGREVLRKSCSIWDLGREFGTQISGILKEFA